MLELRITHVKPGFPTKVWDAKLMNDRKDIRVFPNGTQGDATEFIEINVMRNDEAMGSYLPRKLLAQAKGESVQHLSKSQRKKLAKKKAKK